MGETVKIYRCCTKVINGEMTGNQIIRGGKIVQGIGTGIILAIILIVILEIFRFFRRITNLSREIDDLKRKVNSIEEVIKNQEELY
ncbi:hypothetical protein [Clostridium sp.]|uniref:hypothetical protein n=1 Tax=Clostridium sp. TaxID=1506 RepID=UPI00284DFEA4|nr:hypothetical protein [Clostridium sp.]MDR3598028.1 hypothetical protein [Clostridium sp.]